MARPKTKSAQDIQDNVLLKMPAEKKIKMVSNFFELGKKLNPEYFQNYGAGKIINGHSKNTGKS